MNFSTEQRQAIETFDKNICVFAGAGSGKTSILVERFLYAITVKHIEPDRILALTFTEKAANEMKIRLVSECDKRGLSGLRRKLENAMIGTIHGFCAKILKENPIESGVDPAFQILGEGEGEILMDQVMDGLFEEQSQNTPWLKILLDFGEEQIRAAFKIFYSQSKSMADDSSLFSYSIFKGERENLETRLLQAAREILKQDPTKEGAKRILTVFEKKGKRDWESLRSVEEAMGGLRRAGKLKEKIEDLHALADRWFAHCVQDLADPLKKIFLEIFHEFKIRTDAEKQKKASCDFEDLLYFTYRLLSNDSAPQRKVRERYRRFFFAIFVDECQDTSPLQAKIIELLKNRNNLFVVGDAQQSIYGFRYAEPEVFRRWGRDSQRIILSDNYRSRPEILLFINDFFQPVFTELPFEPLQPKRYFPPHVFGSVELWGVEMDKEKKMTLEMARVAEARTLAQRIKTWVEEKKFDYRDIGILMRTTAASCFYEKELSDLGIPTHAVKGKGFYSQPEIVDIVNFLTLVENPYRDIALAGVLRSALVGITDDALFWLARAAKADDELRPLWKAFEKLEAMEALSGEDREKLLKCRALLAHLRKSKNESKVSGMILEILQDTGYDAVLMAGADGKQKVANLWKLLDRARGLEAKGILGVDAFIRFLKNLSEREVVEPEARIAGEMENSVTLSTVHAAKGLEFPCVILADMGAEGSKNSRGNLLSLKDVGLGFKLKKPWDGKWLPDATAKVIEEILDKKESDEQNRLLYVAMTRAKDHLVFSGALKSTMKKLAERMNSVHGVA